MGNWAQVYISIRDLSTLTTTRTLLFVSSVARAQCCESESVNSLWSSPPTCIRDCIRGQTLLLCNRVLYFGHSHPSYTLTCKLSTNRRQPVEWLFIGKLPLNQPDLPRELYNKNLKWSWLAMSTANRANERAPYTVSPIPFMCYWRNSRLCSMG